MDTKVLKEMITVVRTEQERRLSLLNGEGAVDEWLFRDRPFLNALCLMFLVMLRHHVERELIGLAARVNENAKEISKQEYQAQVEQLKKKDRKGRDIGWDWKTIRNRLQLESFEKHRFTEALRLLSNSYKHNPAMEPDDELLRLLQLETGVPYASLPESVDLREGFADFLGLDREADYCDIADRFVDIVSDFLVEVTNCARPSHIKWGKVSLNPKDFAR
jgi:hypothetical protein